MVFNTVGFMFIVDNFSSKFFATKPITKHILIALVLISLNNRFILKFVFKKIKLAILAG